MMKKLGYILATLTVLLIAGCDAGDHDRIPAAAVFVEFKSQVVWDQYGVTGSFMHRRFIRNQNEPAGFPYTISSATGYSGLMLVTNEHATPFVYDLCCPVEINSNIRIEFDDENLCLRCPRCGSTYDISTGGPMTGPAADGRYFLQSYIIAPYGTAGGWRISR